MRNWHDKENTKAYGLMAGKDSAFIDLLRFEFGGDCKIHDVEEFSKAFIEGYNDTLEKSTHMTAFDEWARCMLSGRIGKEIK